MANYGSDPLWFTNLMVCVRIFLLAWVRTITLQLRTVGENIIATTKVRNNYGAIQSFIFTILR